MPESVYEFNCKTMSGEEKPLSDYSGKVLLIVNTASKCGLTPQFEGLESLYARHRDKGFEILGFPCNQFAKQDPGSDEEIQEFCQLNYGVTFPMFSKIKVNGPGTDPLFTYLRKQARGALGSTAIKWNFTKFLVDREGNVLRRYAPQVTPESIEADIEALL